MENKSKSSNGRVHSEFGNKNYPLVFGKGDWFDLFFRLNHTKMESYVKGNRKAEKDYNTTEEDFAGEFQYQLDNKEFKTTGFL